MVKKRARRLAVALVFIVLLAIPLACDQEKSKLPESSPPQSSITSPWSEGADCGICHVFKLEAGINSGCIGAIHASGAVGCLACHENTGNILADVHAGYTSKKPATELKRTSVAYPINKVYNCYEQCHSFADLNAKNTQFRNPHDNHNVNQNCNVCHKLNEPSVMWCTQCHAEAVVPDGWLSYKEWYEQKKAEK